MPFPVKLQNNVINYSNNTVYGYICKKQNTGLRELD